MNVIARFVSLDSMVAKARATAARFPYTLASAIVGAGTIIRLIHLDQPDPPAVLVKLTLVCALGLPLFTALSTYAERLTWPTVGRQTFPVLGIVLLALYYLSLPDTLPHSVQHLVRTLLLAVGLHFLAAFIAYARPGETAGFWQYNKTLFVRFVQTGIFSAVLFGGLAIAIASIDHLFDAGIDDKVYAYLWVLIAGVFQTWVFLAGVPTREEALRDLSDYPAILKIFAQYILMTLVIVYFGILIIYELKIIVTWNWPKGWVSQLVLWYSVVGILALLLLYPLRDDRNQQWVTWFDRWFFRGLVPLVAMLFIAIYIRVADYGITVPRYLVLGMAIGLAVVVVYFLFSRKRDIRIIPIVLCCLALLSAFGPLSAFSVSERSQLDRLRDFIAAYDIYADGSFREAASEIPFADQREMSSIISYLCEWHGLQSFRPWFNHSVLEAWEADSASYRQAQLIAGAMHIEWTPEWQREERARAFEIKAEAGSEAIVPSSGFDYVIDYYSPLETAHQLVAKFDDYSCWVSHIQETGDLRVSITGPDSVEIEATDFQVGEWLSQLQPQKSESVLTADQRSLDYQGRSFDLRLVIRSSHGALDDSPYRPSGLRAWLLIRRK